LSAAQSAPSPADSSAPNYEDEDIGTRAKDPIEKINRGTFAFNHQFYRFIGRPLAKITTTVIPPPALEALGNFFDNLKSPVRISASLLQANFKRATQETAKLALNSTVGIGGLRKSSDHVASLKDIPAEDFGRTFGKWGIPMGPYLVLPVLGPRSLRDLVGEVADTCATPQTWVSNETLRYSVEGSNALIENPDRIDLYDSTTKDALDPYISMREAYTNYRIRR
jgi:phospholipid-binding lipoprotein MlaA